MIVGFLKINNQEMKNNNLKFKKKTKGLLHFIESLFQNFFKSHKLS
jgi:hypothetical protein